MEPMRRRELQAGIKERRADPEFQKRIKRRLKEDRKVLDRLATDGPGQK